MSSRNSFGIWMLKQVQHDNTLSLIRYPLAVENREELLEKAKKQNIFLGKWYDHPVSPKDLNLSRVEYRLGSCPRAEEVCQKIINLPTNISIGEANKIIKILVLSKSKD